MSHTSRPWRKLLAPFALSALGLLALSAAGSTGAPAVTGLLPEGALGPTPQQRLLAPRIASILEQNHYPYRDRRPGLAAGIRSLPVSPRRPAQLLSGRRRDRI